MALLNLVSECCLIIEQAEAFVSKPWFKSEAEAHGYDGHLGTEPHDLAPISARIMESFESKGLALDHDMFSHGNNPHGCGHAPRTHTNGLRTTSAELSVHIPADDEVVLGLDCGRC